MDMFYGLMGLDHSVNLQRWVIKAVIRALRLRYELLDNGSIARIVLKMAERLEYSAKRFQFAIVHCEFLYTLCDKVPLRILINIHTPLKISSLFPNCISPHSPSFHPSCCQRTTPDPVHTRR